MRNNEQNVCATYLCMNVDLILYKVSMICRGGRLKRYYVLRVYILKEITEWIKLFRQVYTGITLQVSSYFYLFELNITANVAVLCLERVGTCFWNNSLGR